MADLVFSLRQLGFTTFGQCISTIYNNYTSVYLAHYEIARVYVGKVGIMAQNYSHKEVSE